jgi:hypothetical protein
MLIQQAKAHESLAMALGVIDGVISSKHYYQQHANGAQIYPKNSLTRFFSRIILSRVTSLRKAAPLYLLALPYCPDIKLRTT